MAAVQDFKRNNQDVRLSFIFNFFPIQEIYSFLGLPEMEWETCKGWERRIKER